MWQHKAEWCYLHDEQPILDKYKDWQLVSVIFYKDDDGIGCVRMYFSKKVEG